MHKCYFRFYCVIPFHGVEVDHNNLTFTIGGQ